MNIPRPHRPGVVAALAALAVGAVATTVSLPAAAADESMLQRFGTCQESWLDWQENDPRQSQFVRNLEARLNRQDVSAGFTPKSPMTAFGLPVSQVFPQSVGMALGFSMIVDADFVQTRRAFEKQLGKAMNCAISDGVPSCELKLGAKRIAVLATDDPRRKTTLAGCYYFYQQ